MKKKYEISDGKELVSLRKRPMKNGGASLYLDYIIQGKRVREFLKMYLVPVKTKIDSFQNEETLKTALAAKAKKIVAIQNGNTGFAFKAGRDILLADYLDERREKYSQAGKTSYANIVKECRAVCLAYNPKTKLSQVDKAYLLGLLQELRGRGLSNGSVAIYFQALSISLNYAVHDDLIPENPVKRLSISDKPRRDESERTFLTLDEVQALSDTPYSRDVLRRAFLFSCFTGLRISDIEQLTWGDIRKTTGGGWQIEKKMQKTKSLVIIPLSDNALSWLPKRGQNKDRVWEGLPTRPTYGYHLAKWAKAAGIDKHITFHCARHTYATLLLTFGADIYTVSSLLGHKNLSTTQIYAKVVNEKKQRAVNLIPKIN